MSGVDDKFARALNAVTELSRDRSVGLLVTHRLLEQIAERLDKMIIEICEEAYPDNEEVMIIEICEEAYPDNEEVEDG